MSRTTTAPARTPPGSARRRRALRTALLCVLVLLVLAVVGPLGLGWYVSSVALVPNHGKVSNVVLGVREVDGVARVALPATDDNAAPGLHNLSWNGGAALLGEVVSRTPGRVERPVLHGTVPTAGRSATLGWFYTGDPTTTLGLGFSEISVPTELGPAPAWRIPATGPASSTWVIMVHGQDGTRDSILFPVPTLHRLGYSVLDVTYRNDLGAPASPDGLMHLGESEWRDVDAAMRTALAQGATRLVLYGTSMGGVVVLQTLAHSPLAATVSSVVLDAPESDWRKVADFQTGRWHLPGYASRLAAKVIEWRAGIDFGQLALLEHPPAHRPPMLLFHGSTDEESPVQASRDVAASAGRLHWPIRYEEFPGAGHVHSWNVDPGRYQGDLADFLVHGPAHPG